MVIALGRGDGKAIGPGHAPLCVRAAIVVGLHAVVGGAKVPAAGHVRLEAGTVARATAAIVPALFPVTLS